MISFSIKTNDLEQGFKKLSEAAGENALRAAGAAGAALLRDEAKSRVPTKTGALRDNVIIKRVDEKAKGNESQTYIVTARNKPTFYWRFVEFGTAKMAARPFLRPAFDARSGDALNKMREVLKAKLKEALA